MNSLICNSIAFDDDGMGHRLTVIQRCCNVLFVVIYSTHCYWVEVTEYSINHFKGSTFGVFKAMAQIFDTHGFSGLYQSHSVTLLRIFPSAAIRFMAYEQFRMVCGWSCCLLPAISAPHTHTRQKLSIPPFSSRIVCRFVPSMAPLYSHASSLRTFRRSLHLSI